MRQPSTGATHRFGHTLYVVMPREISYTIAGVASLYDPYLGRKCNLVDDHMAVMFLINMEKPIHPCRKITYRKNSDICIPEFFRDLETNDIVNRPVGSTDYLIKGYNKSIPFILNKHAPSSRIVTLRTNTSWYSDDLRSAKLHCRKTERKWRSTGLVVHHLIYRDLCQRRTHFYSRKRADSTA